MRATVAALAVLAALSVAALITAKTMAFPTPGTDVVPGGSVFIGHDCGEWPRS